MKKKKKTVHGGYKDTFRSLHRHDIPKDKGQNVQFPPMRCGCIFLLAKTSTIGQTTLSTDNVLT